MAAIGDVYSSIIGRIRQTTNIPFVHIWNNQLEQLAEGKTYVFPFPNCFVEVTAPTEYAPLLLGYSVGDIIVRIHIGHEEYDAGNGNYEENTNVFLLRDMIINRLNNFQPTACSSLMKISEEQDYEHTNIYHYKIDFKCAFIDSKGSYDEQNSFVPVIPTDLQTITDVVPASEFAVDLTVIPKLNDI